MALEVPDRAARLVDPVPVAVRLRPPESEGLPERLGASDRAPGGLAVNRDRRVDRLMCNHRFQFFLTLVSQIALWTVILAGCSAPLCRASTSGRRARGTSRSASCA